MIIDLTKHIKVIRPEAKSRFPYSNSLFIDDDTKVMIDAGSGGRAYAATPTDQINLLLLTHHHFDHINGLEFFHNAQKMAGQEEAWAFQDESQYYQSMGYDRWQEFMGQPKAGEWREFINLPEDVPTSPGFQPVELAGVFADGDVFDLGETSLTAIHTPGHSPGHYAFYIPGERILFSGDLDLSPRGPWFGFECCDLDEIIDSVYKLIALKPQILVTSHRKVMDSRVGDLLLQYLDIALNREERIAKYLTIPRTLNDIANHDLDNDTRQTDEHIVFWHKVMINKHLKRLERLGQVVKTKDGKYVAVR